MTVVSGDSGAIVIRSDSGNSKCQFSICEHFALKKKSSLASFSW